MSFQKYQRPIKHVIIISALGLWIFYNYYQATSWKLPPIADNKVSAVFGTIAEPPIQHQDYLSFVMHATKLNQQKINTNLKLSCYKNCPDFRVGDIWQLTVKLKPIHATQNPGANNQDLYYLSKKIGAHGYVITKAKNRLLQRITKQFNLNHLRSYLHNQIIENLHGQPYAGIIASLVTGMRADINQENWQILRQTGTVHFVAIAGLHLGFVVSLVYLLSKFLLGVVYPQLFIFISANTICALFIVGHEI